MDYEHGLLHISTGKTGEVRSRKISDVIRVVLAKPSRICEYVCTRSCLRLRKIQIWVVAQSFQSNVICQKELNDIFFEAQLRLSFFEARW